MFTVIQRCHIQVTGNLQYLLGFRALVYNSNHTKASFFYRNKVIELPEMIRPEKIHKELLIFSLEKGDVVKSSWINTVSVLHRTVFSLPLSSFYFSAYIFFTAHLSRHYLHLTSSQNISQIVSSPLVHILPKNCSKFQKMILDYKKGASVLLRCHSFHNIFHWNTSPFF